MLTAAYGSEQSAAAGTLVRRVATRTFGTYDLGARIRYAAIERELAALAPAPPSVLDAGCGRGPLCFAMRRRWRRARIVGVDPDAELIDHCRRLQAATISSASPIHFERRALPADLGERFALVTCVDVLEHVEDDAAFLAGLAALTDAGGTLVMHTPAVPKRRYIASFEEQHDHVRPGYAPERLTALLGQAGYKNIRLRHTFGAAGAVAWEGFALARRGRLISRAALPLWYALAALDGLSAHVAGNGLLAVARKRG